MTVAEDSSGVRRNRGARTKGRVLAVQLVYSYEQNRYQDDCQFVPEEDLRNVDEEGRTFAFSLFELFKAQRPAVDSAIDKRLVNWTISRLAVIDRAILRLGAVELLYCHDTPHKVAINEYIELAKRYGTEANTARLVNGVLDRIAKDNKGGSLADNAPPPAAAK